MTPDPAPQPAELDPAMVEAAAREWHENDPTEPRAWDALADDERGWYVETTRKSLAAAGVPGLVAEVERLRYDLDHSYSQREWSALTARATSAEQERDRYREALETIAGATTIADAVPDVRAFARDALAGSGEQPGACDRSGEWCRTHREAWPCQAGLMAGTLTTDDVRPAPVVPDSEGLRVDDDWLHIYWRDPVEGCWVAYRRADCVGEEELPSGRLLAVVGQGVTAGERRYSVGDPDPTPDGSENLCEAQRDGLVCTWPADHDHPQHVAGAGDEIVAVWDVRSGEQEG